MRTDMAEGKRVLAVVDEGGETVGQLVEEETGSSLTLERAAAAKKYIENHYKSHMKGMQERRQRYLCSSECDIYTFIYMQSVCNWGT